MGTKHAIIRKRKVCDCKRAQRAWKVETPKKYICSPHQVCIQNLNFLPQFGEEMAKEVFFSRSKKGSPSHLLKMIFAYSPLMESRKNNVRNFSHSVLPLPNLGVTEFWHEVIPTLEYQIRHQWRAVSFYARQARKK